MFQVANKNCDTTCCDKRELQSRNLAQLKMFGENLRPWLLESAAYRMAATVGTFFSDDLSLSLLIFPAHLFLLCSRIMFSIRCLSHSSRARSVLRPARLGPLRHQYHVFHEEQATVLPNKVETASATFKVGYITPQYL